MSDIWDDQSTEQLRETCRDMYRGLQVLLSRKTLEDEFAMAALKGILAHGHSWHDNESLSAEIYKIARACMAERSKK